MKWRLFTGSMVVIASVAILVLSLVSPPVPEPVPESVLPEEVHSAGIPTRLKIPKLNVDAAIEQIGLTSEGAVDVPTGPANAAWFNRGPRPGEIGSAVIDGHFGWKDGIPAVFDALHTLKKGDTLSVEDEEGVTRTFVVRELRFYDWDENAPDVFGVLDRKAHLNLITCKGAWDIGQQSYAERLVVFADMVE